MTDIYIIDFFCILLQHISFSSFPSPGSRDGTLALWSVIDAFNSDLMGESSGGSIKTIKPRCKRRLQSSDGFMHEDDLFTHKVRALEFNNNRKVKLDTSNILSFEIGTTNLHHHHSSVDSSVVNMG